jgi:hypothetical protein
MDFDLAAMVNRGHSRYTSAKAAREINRVVLYPELFLYFSPTNSASSNCNLSFFGV